MKDASLSYAKEVFFCSHAYYTRRKKQMTFCEEVRREIKLGSFKVISWAIKVSENEVAQYDFE